MGLEQISFVYFNFVIIVIALFWFFFLAAYVLRHLTTIARTHSTISSFCSDPGSFANRFLLAITASLGNNLACLLVEEYNSRQDQDIRFWFEVSVAMMLPLIGIFHTASGDYSRKFDFGLFQIPVIISEILHSFAALAYFFTFSVINTMYSYTIFNRSQWDPWPTIFLVFTVTSDVILIVFLGLQGYIYLHAPPKPKAKNALLDVSSEGSFGDLPVDVEVDGGGNFSSVGQSAASGWYAKHLHVYAASIILEALLVLLVTFVATAGSMRRNDAIPWFR